MKAICCTFFLCSSILLSYPLIAQSDAFPLALGNRWVYENEEGDLLTRNIVSVQNINGVDYFTRVDSVFLSNEVWSVDTIMLFDHPDNPNDVMAVADELPVDTMKIRQHQYFSNPHYGGSEEWSVLYIPENLLFDSVRVTAGHAYIGTDEVPQIGLSGVFSFGLSIDLYQQDTLVIHSEEYPDGYYPSVGSTIYNYYPGDLTVYHQQGHFTLIAYQLQTLTGVDSWTLPEGLKIYPNPAVDQIFFDVSEVSFKTEVLGIVDVFGRIVTLSDTFNPAFSTIYQFDISHLPTGMYFFLVKIDQQLTTLKFSKR